MTQIALQIARMVAHFATFLDLTDDETLDPDVAVETMEQLASDLAALDAGFLRELVDAFPVIALEYDGEMQEAVRRIPRDYYLEEELAADDPVRLAELEAQRDAED
jgi:hypothetical protein